MDSRLHDDSRPGTVGAAVFAEDLLFLRRQEKQIQYRREKANYPFTNRKK